MLVTEWKSPWNSSSSREEGEPGQSKARFIEVDERMRTGADNVWAVGDITGSGLFTHVATYQARILTNEILGNDGDDGDHRALNRVTFTDPEVGSVGLSDAAAREAGIDVRISTQKVEWTTRVWLHGPGNEGIIKLVEDRSRGILVGATSVGPHGGEVLRMLALAVHAAVPVDTLRTMIPLPPGEPVDDARSDAATQRLGHAAAVAARSPLRPLSLTRLTTGVGHGGVALDDRRVDADRDGLE